MFGQLENVNQGDELLLGELVAVNTKGRKEGPRLLFLGAALETHGVGQPLLHSSRGEAIVSRGSIIPVRFPNIPQNRFQIVRDEMPEIFFLLYLRRFQRVQVQVAAVLPAFQQDHLPGSLQDGVHILDPHIRDPVNVNLRVQHEPLKSLVADQLRQQPVIEPARL